MGADVSATKFPWISIPPVAQPGLPHAFADREQQLAELYKAMVAAGNAVRAGKRGIRHRYVVSGYMGVGKSALINQALGMVQDAFGVVEGQQLTLPVDLPEPDDRERWLILRTSGKHVPSVDAIADAIRSSVLSFLDDVREEVDRSVPSALQISLFHRLFRRREVKLFNEVRSALLTLARTIEYVRAWQGSTVRLKMESSSQSEATRGIEVDAEAELRKLVREPPSVEGKAAFKLAAGYIHKWATSMRVDTAVERQVVVSADLVVDALNSFFTATERAGIPSILVLDDFDEFASSIGPSHHQRAEVLSSVLGAFSKLQPTCLVIGLREEYKHEDIGRQYQGIHVPPLTRATAGQALSAWGSVQQPALTGKVMRALQTLGDRFLEAFDQDEPVVIPFRFLQLVAWVANNAPAWHETPARDLLLKYFRNSISSEAYRAVRRVCEVMPEDDIARCAEAVPVEAEAYALRPSERRALEKEGLMRPAMAGDPADQRVVIDPLCAYLRLAGSGKPVRAAPPGAANAT